MTQHTGNDSPQIAAAINMAIELDRRGQTRSAIELLARVAVEFPQAAGVHSYLAWFSLQADLCAEAVEHGRQAVELAPASEKASLIYFHALWRSEHQALALDEMRRFLAVHPSNEYSRMAKELGLGAETR